jgi:hypothetical protein
MIKCPFCHFDNEDGALFCERCTSDLSGVASTPARSAPPPPPPPVAPAIPMAEAFPVGSDPVFAEAVPMAVAEPIEALPLVTAEPMDEPLAEPMAEPIAVEPMAVPALQLEPVAAPEPQARSQPEPMDLPAVEPLPLAPVEPPPAARAEPAPAPAPVPAPAPAPAAPAPAPAPAEGAAAPLPPGAQPRLLVLRGQKRNVEYPVYEGLNFIGRADEKPVDIDLEEQEPPDRIWCSRQHACIAFENDQLLIEDLNSANGTYVNRTRVYPGQKKPLAIGDVVQIGNVQLKVLA